MNSLHYFAILTKPPCPKTGHYSDGTTLFACPSGQYDSHSGYFNNGCISCPSGQWSSAGQYVRNEHKSVYVKYSLMRRLAFSLLIVSSLFAFDRCVNLHRLRFRILYRRKRSNKQSVHCLSGGYGHLRVHREQYVPKL